MRWISLIIGIGLLVSCGKDEQADPVYMPDLMEVPQGFPDIDFPEGNEFTLERWELGKRLFFDPVMSVDSSVSCASCHHPELAFSDNVVFSLGVEERLGSRNSPTLANVAYHPYFTREGGVPTLEMQILVPIQEHAEFDFNIVLLAERLQEDPSYVEMSQLAYEQPPSPFVITRALANFERSLLSGYSLYDQYTTYDRAVLSATEIRGMNLFFSERTNCFSCHDGFNFSNYAFENNGLYENYPDPGRFRLTEEEEDRALFKVPTLRNVELTGPYMHDGSLSTLEEIVDHYNAGGANHPNKNALIRPLGLTETEKSDLVSFLKTLTDETFVSNPLFKQ